MVFWFYHRRPCWFTYLQTFLHSLIRYVDLTIGAELLKALPLDCIIQQFLSMSINIRIWKYFSSNRSSKYISSCDRILPQSCLRPIQFFVISIVARCIIFRRLLSVENTVLLFITFLSWRLKPSMILLVYISLRTDAEYLKYVDRVAQWSLHDL